MYYLNLLKNVVHCTNINSEMRFNYRGRIRDIQSRVIRFVRILSAKCHALSGMRYTVELHGRWDEVLLMG